MSDRVRIGVVGTSWWSDAMYLPALTRHPLADVRAVVGTRPGPTREFAARWGIPSAYDDYTAMLDGEDLDAVVIAAPNRHHLPMAAAAIERGLHVLCEKPLGMTSTEARRLAEAAERVGVITMVPFTYRNMPAIRYLRELVDDGYLGRPFHLDMRYFARYLHDGEYLWRFDLGEAGAGVAGDLGSHWMYLARSFFGEIAAVTAVFGRSVAVGPRPDGADYRRGEDSAMILLEFENGATGSLHVSAVAYEPSSFGQLHAMELHGRTAPSITCATGASSSAWTAPGRASRRSTSCRSPIATSPVRAGRPSTTPTGTSSGSRTPRRGRSSAPSPAGCPCNRTSATAWPSSG